MSGVVHPLQLQMHELGGINETMLWIKLLISNPWYTFHFANWSFTPKG